jgi:hypothetical protein
LHHDNKSGGDDEESDQTNARGGGDIVNGVRFELAVKKMTVAQAEKFAIDADRRGYYFRLGSPSSKLNYSAPEESEWFERITYEINGEEVVRCIPWQVPSSKLSPDLTAAVVAAVERGSPSGPYSPQIGNTDRSLGPLLTSLGIATPSAQAKILRELLRAGCIVKGKWQVNAGARFRSGLKSPAGLPYNYEWQDGDCQDD